MKIANRSRNEIFSEMKEIAKNYDTDDDFKTAMCNISALQLEVLLDVRDILITINDSYNINVINKWGSKL